MTLTKRCINCEILLEPGQEDFCSEECKTEFRDACDQEVLANLSKEEEPVHPIVQQILDVINPPAQEFADLLNPPKENKE